MVQYRACLRPARQPQGLWGRGPTSQGRSVGIREREALKGLSRVHPPRVARRRRMGEAAPGLLDIVFVGKGEKEGEREMERVEERENERESESERDKE